MNFNKELICGFTRDRKPNFDNILKILNKEAPARFTLFEFFMNDGLYQELAGYDQVPENFFENLVMRVKAFRNAGYDYCTLPASKFGFPRKKVNQKASISVNEGAVITDWESFDQYNWPNPDDFDTSWLENMKEYLPEGMKIIVSGPGGVLENVTFLLGYDGFCYLLADEPELVERVFEEVGTRLIKYYEGALAHDCVGACFSNDDWGFSTQTMLPPELMRKYVFKWHKKIAQTIHNAGRPVVLHSCGQLEAVYDDIIYDMKYDGKHSYEDKILPVEQAYEKLVGKLAVMGGLDLDFVTRRPPSEVYERACAMLKRTKERGGFGLGSGNSIPYYVPQENYYAMIYAAFTDTL